MVESHMAFLQISVSRYVYDNYLHNGAYSFYIVSGSMMMMMMITLLPYTCT